jgi:hypothetical protein
MNDLVYICQYYDIRNYIIIDNYFLLNKYILFYENSTRYDGYKDGLAADICECLSDDDFSEYTTKHI